MAKFVGTSGNDVIDGTSGNDVIEGGRGDDRLSGDSGTDHIEGGDGADLIDGGDGGDFLYSAYGMSSPIIEFVDGAYRLSSTARFDTGTEHDVLIGGTGWDHLFVGYGDDAAGGDGGYQGPVGPFYPDIDSLNISFMGASSGMTVDFTTINQTIAGGVISGFEKVAAIQGTSFDDDINAGSTGEVILGMGGNDRIRISAETRYADGGDGDDVLDGSNLLLSTYTGTTIAGGAGNDTVLGARLGGFTVFGGDGDDRIFVKGTVHGGNGNDHIESDNATIYGDAGDDYITYAGENGSLRVAGGSGADTIIGSRSGDYLSTGDAIEFTRAFGGLDTADPLDDLGSEHDVIRADGGNDVVSGGSGDDLDGGAGIDRLRLSLGAQTTGVVFDANSIANGQAAVILGGTIQGFEELSYLRTTDYDDTITLASQTGTDPYRNFARDLPIEVYAGGGNDVITAGGTIANVRGEAGDDRFVSGRAPDYFDGGTGSDTIDYSAYDLDVTVSLVAGTGAERRERDWLGVRR